MQRTRPVISRIQIFPIKSLDGLHLTQATVLPTGALRHDRAWALFDANGRYVNGKRRAAVHRLRSHVGLTERVLSLRREDDLSLPFSTFDLDRDRDAIEAWLQDYFRFSVTFRENIERGFPDDTESLGPTIISVATLAEVGRWFGLPIEQVRARFRSNIEIDGVPPFWEDNLFGAIGAKVRFRLGQVDFEGINPCQRCVVPARDPATGVNDDTFVRRFTELRQKTLPAWSERTRFNHYYRLAINTRLNDASRSNTVCVWGNPLRFSTGRQRCVPIVGGLSSNNPFSGLETSQWTSSDTKSETKAFARSNKLSLRIDSGRIPPESQAITIFDSIFGKCNFVAGLSN